LEGQALHFAPCLPAAWKGFTLQYRWGGAVYAIEVQQVPGAAGVRVLLDGLLQVTAVLPLQDDGVAHGVVVQVPGPLHG
jgi:cellobiose phosphorylase